MKQAERANALYIAKGLTLPIRETDTSLTTPAAELAAARARLVGGESLAEASFDRMVPLIQLVGAKLEFLSSWLRPTLTPRNLHEKRIVLC